MDLLKDLPRDILEKLVDVYAKAWQAMDGAYFLSLEKKYGMDIAIEMDKEAWRIFSPIEAERIMKEFDIPKNGGLSSLEKALRFRVYAVLNEQSIERKSENSLLFTMNACRIQAARNRKGLPDFPCKQVSIIEYEEFAKTIDPRIRTVCKFCPPDNHPDNAFCQWEFSLEE
ncbi:MAG: DUF6125 family protein [Candidatus Thorarchaeota archaeon]